MNTPRTLSASAFFLLSLAAPVLHSQTIPNPGFEADHFMVAPGYASGNGGISGWISSNSTGLNPANGSPRSFTVPPVIPGVNRRFYRVIASP